MYVDYYWTYQDEETGEISDSQFQSLDAAKDYAENEIAETKDHSYLDNGKVLKYYINLLMYRYDEKVDDYAPFVRILHVPVYYEHSTWSSQEDSTMYHNILGLK